MTHLQRFETPGSVTKKVAEVVKTFGAQPKPKLLTSSATKIGLMGQSLLPQN